MSLEYLKSAKTIFWDFDGVIKDSVVVKSHAFRELFLPFGEGVAEKVRRHHEANGGMSRFDKFPIYFEWAGQTSSTKLVTEYSKKLSNIVKQKVISSAWVAGVFRYLHKKHDSQQFFLVTATPQQEIEDILMALKIECFFKDVIGSPTKKSDAIELLLQKYRVSVDQALMIGDSISDYDAAVVNNVPFILRKTDLNKRLQQQLDCNMVDDFNE